MIGVLDNAHHPWGGGAQAYEIRDAATVQLMDLQAAMAREREDFEREMADLEERIAAEDRAARFVMIACGSQQREGGGQFRG